MLKPKAKLVAFESEVPINEAACKKTYSREPKPAKETTDNIEDSKKTKQISITCIVLKPNPSTKQTMLTIWNNWIKTDKEKVLLYIL